jgi:nitrogen fixation protein FixH
MAGLCRRLLPHFQGRNRQGVIKDMAFRFNWGTGVVVLFSLFVAFILGMVFISASRSYYLVEKDYYSQELKYQSRIEQLSRSLEDPSRFAWFYDTNENSVKFRYGGEPDDLIAGEIHFYRPSDSGLDFRIPVQLNSEGMMEVNADGLQKGLCKIKASLTATGAEYYKEEILIIE